MISRQSRRGIIALTLLLALSLWATRREQAEDNAPIEGLDTRLDYALSNFEFQYFDEAGQPAMRMTSPRFTSDTATGLGVANEPRLEMRHEGFLWNIIADQATVTANREIIYLSGEVELQRSGDTPDSWLRLNGSDVTLEVTPRIAHSVRPVALIDLAGTLNATGFMVNMTSNNYRLDYDVRGSYVID